MALIKIYMTLTLPVVLYGCENWSFALREENRSTIFENRVLRRIFGPKRDEITMEWRKIHNEGINDLYCSPNIIGVIKLRMRWARHVERMAGWRGFYRILVGRPEGKRSLGRPSLRWGEILKLKFRKYDEEAWTGLSWHNVKHMWRVHLINNELADHVIFGEFID